MRVYHGTSRIDAQQIVAAGLSQEKCQSFFTTFDLTEARDIYAPFASDGSFRESDVIQIDVDDKLVEELISQDLAKRVEWGFYHWIIFEQKAFEILNKRATFAFASSEGNS